MDWPCKLIVVPIDFSDASLSALQTARKMAGPQSQLRLIYVLPPLESISPGAVWGGLDDATREQSAREYADEYFETHGLGHLPLDIRVGQPGHEITEFADELNADLIVISSHGYHGIKRFLLGSVAETVLRHAHCAVFVVRRPDAD